MNAAASAALAKVRAMCRARELSTDQKRALIALRASLSRLIAGSNEANQIIESSLAGLMPLVDTSGIFSALGHIEKLLAEDRRARGVRP